MSPEHFFIHLLTGRFQIFKTKRTFYFKHFWHISLKISQRVSLMFNQGSRNHFLKFICWVLSVTKSTLWSAISIKPLNTSTGMWLLSVYTRVLIITQSLSVLCLNWRQIWNNWQTVLAANVKINFCLLDFCYFFWPPPPLSYWIRQTNSQLVSQSLPCSGKNFW